MLEKNVVYRQQVNEFGIVREQKVTQILEDGKIIASENTDSQLIAPGQSNALTTDVAREIAKAVHTPEVITAHEARMAEHGLEIG